MSEPAETMVESVARSVASRRADLKDEDQAAVDLAMRYALQIDAAIARGGQDATKGLYLGPHLLKTLAELGCTPVGRVTLAGGSGAALQTGGKLAARRAGRGA